MRSIDFTSGPVLPRRIQPGMFDLGKVLMTSFSIKSYMGKTAGAALENTLITIGDGTAATWDGTDEEWDFTGVSTEGYVYLLFDIVAGTCTINFTEAAPTPDANKGIIQYLWFIAWSSGLTAINGSDIRDLRDQYNIMGAGILDSEVTTYPPSYTLQHDAVYGSKQWYGVDAANNQQVGVLTVTEVEGEDVPVLGYEWIVKYAGGSPGAGTPGYVSTITAGTNAVTVTTGTLTVEDGRLNVGAPGGATDIEISLDFDGLTWNGEKLTVTEIDLAHNELSDMADTTGANQDHDKAYLRAYNTAADAAYVNAGDYHTSGLLIITNTTVAASGDGAIEVVGGGYFGAGIYADKGDAYEAGFFADGTRWAGFGTPLMAGYCTDGARAVNFCDGTYAVNATNGLINSQLGYYDNGTPGQDVANWFGGGILIGSPTEKLVSQLAPTDKVLVL